MKNKIRKYIALGMIAMFSLSSCSDYLDKEPDDQLTLETVFENKTLLNVRSTFMNGDFS